MSEIEQLSMWDYERQVRPAKTFSEIIRAEPVIEVPEPAVEYIEEFLEPIPVFDIDQTLQPSLFDVQAIPKQQPSLSDRFVVPPFSVLDSRQGYWQKRKQQWLAVGMQSELGRDKVQSSLQSAWQAQQESDDEAPAWVTTSIFDPVLCELAYRWFSPADGSVLDPFAGGSVRGIVATLLGRRYAGIDLSHEQVTANRKQANVICGSSLKDGDSVQVKISAKNARLLFNGCDPDYIRDICHAHCCESTTSDMGTLITIHPDEIATIEARGAIIKAGLLQPRPGELKCPFKTSDELCGLHFTPDKPFGCIASPFTLNNNDTLIVRNRYKLLKCYQDGRKQPAYQAFRASLDLIFGVEESQRIRDHLDNGGDDLVATMPAESYRKLKDNDEIKRGKQRSPRWIVGDSRNLNSLTDERFDFIFTCPPYYDLEVYSDDPRDLSNGSSYEEFIADYRKIIAASAAQLKDHRFACIVVGDVRDKSGVYRNFVGDTIQAFLDAGMRLYNEAIFITPTGTLPVRVGNQFRAARKLGKCHQNVLVFVKGDPRKAADDCGIVDVTIGASNGSA